MSNWSENNTSKATLRVWGENIKGQSILLCRYLTPIKPPEEVFKASAERDVFAIEKVARFVSLIPFAEDLDTFKFMADMYATCQEFLDIGAGDFEEHAILLANFFQYVDNVQDPGKFTSFLVFGEALPEGSSVYVMRRFSDEFAKTQKEHKHSIELWNPMNGQCYFFARQESASESSYNYVRSNDPICPLKKIHCVVSSTNIWANIQLFSNPVLLDFDFGNGKAWKPLFASDEQRVALVGPLDQHGAIPTCQPLQADSELLFAKPQENMQQLEMKVMKYLMEQFQDERIRAVRKTTKWKFDSAQQELRSILMVCETQAKMARSGGKASAFKGVAGNQSTELNIREVINVSERTPDFAATGSVDYGTRREGGRPGGPVDHDQCKLSQN